MKLKANQYLSAAARMLELMPVNFCGPLSSAVMKNRPTSTSAARSLRQDWEKVGNDMEKVMSAYEDSSQ
jgi:hypothetical protein